MYFVCSNQLSYKNVDCAIPYIHGDVTSICKKPWSLFDLLTHREKGKTGKNLVKLSLLIQFMASDFEAIW